MLSIHFFYFCCISLTVLYYSIFLSREQKVDRPLKVMILPVSLPLFSTFFGVILCKVTIIYSTSKKSLITIYGIILNSKFQIIGFEINHQHFKFMDKRSLYMKMQLHSNAHYIMILAPFQHIIFIHFGQYISFYFSKQSRLACSLDI